MITQPANLMTLIIQAFTQGLDLFDALERIKPYVLAEESQAALNTLQAQLLAWDKRVRADYGAVIDAAMRDVSEQRSELLRELIMLDTGALSSLDALEKLYQLKRLALRESK